MSNLYHLTKGSHELLFIGTNHAEKFFDLPVGWLRILREYNPTQLFMEMSEDEINADHKSCTRPKYPSTEYLSQLGYLLNESEIPAIN